MDFQLEGLALSDDLLIVFLIIASLLLIGLLIVLVKIIFFSESVEKTLSRKLKKNEFESLIQTAKKEVAKKPSFFAYYYMAQAYEKLGEWDPALQAYIDASVLEAKGKDRKIYTNILIHIARIEERLGRYKEALAYYLMVIEKDEGSVEALYEIAEHHYKLKNLKKAREYLETLLKKRPGILDARFMYGKILYELGNYLLSVKQFELLEKYDTKNAEIYYYKARCMENLRQSSSAITAYKQFLAFDKVKRKMLEEARVNLISLYIKMKDFKNGLIQIETFISDTTGADTKKELIYLHANLLWNSGEEYQAVRQYERVFRIDPDFKDVSVITDKYKQVLKSDYLEFYFTGEDKQFDYSCRRMLGKRNYQLIYRSRDYYIYQKGNYFSVFYRHIEPISFAKLTDVEVLVSGYGQNSPNMEIFSVMGVTQDAVAHGLLKKAILTERDTFLQGAGRLNKAVDTADILKNLADKQNG